MKRLLLCGLLLCPAAVVAGPPPNFPTGINGTGKGWCIAVKGLDGSTCDPYGQKDFGEEYFRQTVVSGMAGLGWGAANAYYPVPLDAKDSACKAMGDRVLAIALRGRIAFPDLGDPILKSTEAVAYCTSSANQQPIDPFDASAARVSGRGRCGDFVTVYLRH